MFNSKPYNQSVSFGTALQTKIGDYAELIKLKLNLLVVTTSLFAYLMSAAHVTWVQCVVLILGGLMISGASGAINEILESDSDSVMKRTMNRPLPAGRMTKTEAWVSSLLILCVGLLMLGMVFNTLTVILSVIVVVLYAFVYTPLKKITPLSVLVGAIPGALPPVIGVAAATGQITPLALFLFVLQFMWQFPHFWAVAFMAKEDYQKAGFKMLPNNEEGSRFVAIQTVFYSASLIMLSAFATMYDIGSWVSLVGLGLAGLVFTMAAVEFYKNFDYSSARKLMFASITYLPVVYLIILIDYLIR